VGLLKNAQLRHSYDEGVCGLEEDLQSPRISSGEIAMNIEPFVYDYVINEVDYPDGAVIMEEGSRGRWIYIVLEGRIRVMKKTSKGMVCVDSLGPGEVFGEMVFLEGNEGLRSASVIAQSEVKVGVLDTERLNADYQALPIRLRALFRSLMMELKEVTSRVCTAVSGSS
jgi:hypothetical protein